MITPEWYSAELNHLKVHKELHESILRDIVRRLVKTDFNVSDSAAWQAEKLQQSGMVFDDVIAEIAKRTDKSREEIKAAFVKASTDIFDFDDKELADAGYDAQQFKILSPAMKRIVNAAYKKTFTEARNLTLTTAVTSQTAYIQAADLAYMKVESGAFTFQEAMRTAVKSAAVQGLNVVYPSGHVSSLDAAMRRALLTGLNQTTGKLQIMRAEELDNDIMEISAHYGARPSHAEWQGQLVSLSGQKGFLTLDDIGYGAVDGFMGANCRHSWNVFFYGLSKPRYSAEELEYYKNAEVEYNGEKMKAYEAQQKQRSMERAVKQSKSTLVAYDEAMKNVGFDEERSAWMQEFEKESVKLKNREAKLVDFCEQTGLQRDRFREQVFATNTMNGVKGFGKSTSAKAVRSAQNHYDIWRKSIGAENTPKTLAKYYEMKYNDKAEYSRLQKYAHMVDKGEVSPLLGYAEYRKKALEIEDKVIGITAKDGTVIKDYSSHFVSRAIGRSALDVHFNRPGVEVDDIKDALVNGEIGKSQTNSAGQTSRLFVSEKCKVSVNTDTGNLVQTNTCT